MIQRKEASEIEPIIKQLYDLLPLKSSKKETESGNPFAPKQVKKQKIDFKETAVIGIRTPIIQDEITEHSRKFQASFLKKRSRPHSHQALFDKYINKKEIDQKKKSKILEKMNDSLILLKESFTPLFICQTKSQKLRTAKSNKLFGTQKVKEINILLEEPINYDFRVLIHRSRKLSDLLIRVKEALENLNLEVNFDIDSLTFRSDRGLLLDLDAKIEECFYSNFAKMRVSFKMKGNKQEILQVDSIINVSNNSHSKNQKISKIEKVKNYAPNLGSYNSTPSKVQLHRM